VTKLSNLVKKADGESRELSATSPAPPPTRAIISGSNEQVQQIRSLYETAVDRLEDALSTVRNGGGTPDFDAPWAAAQQLLPVIETSKRILLGLVARDYNEKTVAYHSINVFVLTVHAADGLSQSTDEQITLARAALYHDIGMALVPNEIVGKKRALSAAEEAEVRKHSDHGAGLLAGLGNDLLCALLKQSHERVDGKGYPAGLHDQDIHPLAKLLHAADSYEAIVHRRAYKFRLSPYEAMKTIKSGVGTHFGQEAFRLLLKAVGAFPIGTLVELNTRERSKVVDNNAEQLLRPAVAILTGPDGADLPAARFLDLSESTGVYVARALVDEELQEKSIDIF